ncbi:MAG: hypothetical protein ACFFAN_06090 [Promethearchaeota archaeon]
MVKVQLNCPSCSKTGFIEIGTKTLKESKRGLLTFNVAKGFLCSHSFIVYIDNNLTIRDYFTTDFQLELPEITPEEKIEAGKIPSENIVDIDLIKLNIPATLLTYILKSIFFKQKIVIICDQNFLHIHIYNFFKYITQNSFEANIIIITEETYNNNKKNYKDSMVFESINIINNPKKLINLKKLLVEKQIINNFMTELNTKNSHIILKNEMFKAYTFSKAILNHINECKEKKLKVNTLKIKTQLEEYYKTKINLIYFNFLTDIVEKYYEVSLPTILESFVRI